MEFFDEESRPRILLQSRSIPKSTTQNQSPQTLETIHKPTLFLSLSLSAILLSLFIFYFSYDPFQSLLIWCSLSFLVGPFSPLNLTAGDIWVGQGSTIQPSSPLRYSIAFTIKQTNPLNISSTASRSLNEVSGDIVLLGNDSDVCRSRYRLSSWYEGMWVRIAMLYSQAGMGYNAHNVFDEMLERKRCDLGEKSLCGVVPVFVGNGVFGERLDKVLEFVENTGVKPGVKANNLLVRGYVKGGRLANNFSMERSVFFLDVDNKLRVKTEDMRFSRDWCSDTDEWKYRGDWVFLEVLEELEIEWPILVSVKQIWYEVRMKKRFGKEIKEWTCKLRDVWKETVKEVVLDNLKFTMVEYVPDLAIEPRCCQDAIFEFNGATNSSLKPSVCLMKERAF